MNIDAFVSWLRRIRIPRDVFVRALFSIAVALVLWGLVTTQEDPPVARSFDDLPIQNPDLPNNLDIPVDLGTVSIRLEGPRSVIEGITTESLAPHINVDGITEPGTYIVPVEINAPGVVDRELTPAQLSVIVDVSETRSFTLVEEIAPIDDPSRTVANVIPNVREVSVTGPRSIVERVARVIYHVDIGDQITTYTDEFPTEAVDAEGIPIPEVEVRPRRVSASVEVVSQGRLVPVLIQTVGNPAAGYDVVDRVVTPQSVLLDGPQDILDGLISVSTEQIDLEGAAETITRRVGLTGIPPGVSVVDPPTGEVLVVIQFQQRGVTQLLPAQTVLLGDVPDGMVAEAVPAALDVVVFASEEALSELRVGDVAPRVSLAGLDPGTYELRPSVLLPPDIRWLRTEPETVLVTLRRDQATPVTTSPTATPSPPLATPRPPGETPE